jgi:hypothetical protein
MFKYKLLLDEGLLFLRFVDEYVADEGDQGVLRIVQTMTFDEIYSLKMVIWDLKDVTSMTLRDSDGARSAYFEKQLLSFIARSEEFSKKPGNAAEHAGKDVLEFLNSLKLLCVRPEDGVVRGIFAERLKRIASHSKDVQSLSIGEANNLHELLQSLDLLRLEPMLEGELLVI